MRNTLIALLTLFCLAPASAQDKLYDVSQVLNAHRVPEFHDKAVVKSLETNGFVILHDALPTPSPDETPEPIQMRWRHFYELYESLRYNDEPAFVTSDATLHYGHELFDFTLMQLEEQTLSNLVDQMLTGLIATTEEQRHAASGDVQKAARANLAYLCIARQLLRPSFKPPAEVAALVRQEIHLVNAAAGQAPSPLLGRQQDYSQFKPRGHYTKTAGLKAYFRAFMWLGQADMPPDHRSTLFQGLLLTSAMEQRQGYTLWSRLDRVLVEIVGPTASANPRRYRTMVQQVWGHVPSVTDLNDAKRVARFETLATRPVSTSDPLQSSDVSFRLAGQRAVPDTYVLTQLLYPKVGTSQKPRTMISGQDFMAALGSPMAESLQQASEQHFDNYTSQLQKMTAWLAGLPGSRWTANVYWAWLNSLRPLFEQARGPAFMKTAAWAAKSLNTALGSWTELRHDTILYAQPSFAEGGEGRHFVPLVLAKGYVEPVPEVYGRILTMTRKLRTLLQDEKLMPTGVQDADTLYESMVANLQTIANEELQGTPLSLDDYNVIREFGRVMEKLHRKVRTKKAPDGGYEPTSMALVADVHTDTQAGLCLEEGVGGPEEILVLVPIDGHTVAVRGGVFSHFEFTQPISDRLDDQQWERRLLSKTPPARHAWLADLTASVTNDIRYSVEPENLPEGSRASNVVVEGVQQISWAPQGGDFCPSLSFYGRSSELLFASRRAGHGDIWISRPDGTDQFPLTPADVDASQPAWLPFESKFVFLDTHQNMTMFSYTGDDGERPDYPYVHQTVHLGSFIPPTTNLTSFYIGQEERLLLVYGNQVHILDPGTVGPWDPRPDASHPVKSTTLNLGMDVGSATVDSQQKRIAFSAKHDGHEDIFVTDYAGHASKALTHGEGNNRLPSWSPDGKMLVFVSDRGGHDNLWVMNADGTSPTRLTDDTEGDTTPCWSSHSNQIVFASRRHGGLSHLWLLRLGSNRPAKKP